MRLEPRTGQYSSSLHMLMLKCRIPAQTNRVWKGRSVHAQASLPHPGGIRIFWTLEAWTDISKHHIKCRDFELKLENSPRAVWMQLCPLFCTEARSQKHNLSPHSPFLSPMWQLPPSQLNISQSLQCPTGFHHPKSSQADSPCPSLSSILSCSSSQGVPSNNTKPASRMKNIWVLEFNPLCLPSPAHHRQAMDPFQHQACPPKSLWAGVMLSMKKRDAFPARNTRQQVNLPELPKATRYK